MWLFLQLQARKMIIFEFYDGDKVVQLNFLVKRYFTPTFFYTF